MNDADRKLLGSLTAAEQAYAAAYGDHLSVGDPYPISRDYGIDPNVAFDIRGALHREWRARLDGSPALSGRLRVTRRIERRTPSD